ncbi:MAG: FtsX-like permease family protein [Luteitalea sp.]|nr:FtsX-like permease family protein [Luteitalea sp.]
MTRGRLRIRALVRRHHDQELQDELQLHMKLLEDEYRAQGMTEAEAQAAARRQFGNATQIKEQSHDLFAFGFLDDLFRDLRFAARSLRKSPAFAAAAVLTLAIGIGGNTAMFSVIHGVLLRPLDYPDPDRLVFLARENPDEVTSGRFSLERLDEMRTAARSYTGLGAFLAHPEDVTFSGNGDPEVLTAARVSANFADILGVRPVLGRSFLAEEDTSGGPAVAMISAELWKRRFGADPSLAGKTAILNSTSYAIIGVLPAGFQFPFPAVDVWVTRPAESSNLEPTFRRCCSPLFGFARLKPGVTLQQARSELNVLNERYATAYPNKRVYAGPLRLTQLKDQLTENVSTMLWMLLGAVGFVLLIACANVASLLMARATSRSRELAMRTALGASRGRVIRQLLTESMVLAVAGGMLGLLLARFLFGVITSMTAFDLPRAEEIHIDGVVLGFTVALSIATGAMFGIVPALRAVRPSVVDMLRQSGAAGAGTFGKRGKLGVSTWGMLVVAQVALSMVLLVGAALMMKSLAQVASVDPGLQAAGLLTMRIPLPATRYDTFEKRAAFFDELVRRIETVPGVRGATVVRKLPTTLGRLGTNLQIQGQEIAEPGHLGIALQSITPGYFRVLGIPLKRGRELTARDNTSGAPPAVIINESFARRFWSAYPGGEDPVGKRIKVPILDVGPLEIVGVVGDVHERGLTRNTEPQFYIPQWLYPPNNAYLAVRTEQEPLRSVSAIRAEVRAVDRAQAVADIRTMDMILAASVGQQHLATWLLGLFAGTALLLAMVGIYGVLAYSVAQRTQEIGIRRALGAQASDILTNVMGHGLALALAGVALGIGGAFALTRIVTGLLFRTSPTDPATFAGIALLFIMVALAASYVPARRAATVDPMRALR